MKVIISGCREFEDYNMIVRELRNHPWTCVGSNIEQVIHGGCRGVDLMADKYFRDVRGWSDDKFIIKPYPKGYGRSGGPIRNREMAEEGDVLIAFWNSYSRGTLDMIRQAVRCGRKTSVIPIKC